MVAAAKASGRQAAIGFTFRRSPAIAAIRDQVERGAIGRPLHFNGHYWCDYGCDPRGPMSWRYKGGPGSGAFSDIGSHLLDLAEFVCGPIRSVRGAVLQTVIAERPFPARHRGRPRGRGSRRPARASGERGPRHPHGDLYLRATRTLSASRVAHGLANALGFELFAESGAVTCDPARAGEFSFVDGTPTA